MEETQEEKSYSKWEWIFYMIIIPALFASILGGVLLSFLGVNVVGKVLGWANTIPYIEKIVPDVPQEADPDAAKKQNVQNQLVTTQTDLNKSKQQLSQMQGESAQKDATIQSLQKQVQDLQKMMEDKKTDAAERQKQFQDLSKIYTSMSPKNAAAIVENLSVEEAVTVLAAMKPEQRADLLAKMDPKKAADISILLKDTTISKDDDIAALQQRVQVLTKALSETRQDSTSMDNLVNSFSQMPAARAADIITALMTTNQKRAISIMAGMANDKRAQVLAAIGEKNTTLAARITSELLR
ncbi:hypothetical protein EDM56_03750 [Brevibacillus fluminis]|uniref:Magnesium transporter MgtE intracellular domain-containing protein n=1 Tax=Brevibacillus fluminis TaxID=511487 RepID=A0A3M8DWI2_9BACL|nr:hypothetical protein [Brevibacillus fluminis]RNB91875.1 hypothetical protein EDM56_03750 [Brevibacillus fluminis]